MKTLDEIIATIAGKTYDELKPIAPKIGLPLDTLYKIIKGYTRRPSFEHVRRIAVYLEGRRARKPRK
ncbi:MAG: hypothetical protein WC655_24830 [Candidatus Hydrogenedentales bacterium]